MIPPLCVVISRLLVQKRAQTQALGRACGEFSTKMHAAFDTRGHLI
ncbi:hypothetical protein [Holospora curviuscula]|nr:hypothetical protein [Holospora curviuscula]